MSRRSVFRSSSAAGTDPGRVGDRISEKGTGLASKKAGYGFGGEIHCGQSPKGIGKGEQGCEHAFLFMSGEISGG